MSDSEYAAPPCSPIPAIQSAVLNIGTAASDCGSARDAWIESNWADAVMWINNAISQLESARAKIEAHTANAAGQGAAKPYPAPACSASLVAQPPRDVSELYHELLYAVERCFPGESRHETALRYIRETERRVSEVGSCMQNAALTGGEAVPSNGVVGTPNQKGGE